MVFLFVLVVIGFVGGQVLSISWEGIRVSVLDISVALLVLSSIWQAPRKILVGWLKILTLFLISCLVSLLLAALKLSISEIIVSSLYLIRWLVYALVPISLAWNKTIQKISLPGLFIGGSLLAFLGLLQYFLYPNLRNLAYLGWDPHAFRVFSTLLDPNFTGIILVLNVWLGAYLVNKNNITRNLALWGLIMSISALLLTYSRGSYLSLFASGFVFLTNSSWHISHPKGMDGSGHPLGVSGLANSSILGLFVLLKKKLYLLLVFILIILGLIVKLPKPSGEGVNLLRTMSIESRIADSQEALAIFRQSPWLGVGFNTLRYFKQGVGDSYNQGNLAHSGAGFHNSWLFILTTTGLIGLIGYIWIWWRIFAPGLFVQQKQASGLYLLLLVSFVALVVHSQFDNSLFYPNVMLWLWILVGNWLNFNQQSR